MDKIYAHRTLVQKLGIKNGFKVLLLNKPESYMEKLTDLPENAIIYSFPYDELRKVKGLFDMIQTFTLSQERLKEIFPTLKKLLKKTGMIWVSWPKGHCAVRSNVNENTVRDIGLTEELVDIKVISIDDMWSGLKFVYRRSDRG